MHIQANGAGFAFTYHELLTPRGAELRGSIPCVAAAVDELRHLSGRGNQFRGGGVDINRDDGVAIKFRHSHRARGAVVEALQCFLALFQGRFGFLASAPHGLEMRADAREQLACREGA